MKNDTLNGREAIKQATIAETLKRIGQLPTGATGPAGPPGADGADGTDGAPGPNNVTTTTTTDLSGILTGDAANVGAITLPSDATKFLDGTGAFTTPAGTGGVTAATIRDAGYYASLTNGNPSSPELVFNDLGETIPVWVPTP